MARGLAGTYGGINWLQAPANRCFAPTREFGSSERATFSGPHADFRGCSRRDALAVRSRQVATVIPVNRQGAPPAVVVIQLHPRGVALAHFRLVPTREFRGHALVGASAHDAPTNQTGNADMLDVRAARRDSARRCVAGRTGHEVSASWLQ